MTISREWTCDKCNSVVTRDPTFADAATECHTNYSGSQCKDAVFFVIEKEIQTAHDWEHLELDGGTMGMYEVWECRQCGGTNSFSPEFKQQPSNDSFWACGCGGDKTNLSEDCDVAKSFIEEHVKVCIHSKCTCGQVKQVHTDKQKLRERFKACDNFKVEPYTGRKQR